MLGALAAAVGAVVVLGDLADLVKALVVPRPQVRGPVSRTIRTARALLYAVAGRITSFTGRDRFLSSAEPLLLLLRLALWLSIGLLGFTFIIWGVGTASFLNSFIEAGSSIFTLGSATAAGTVPTVVTFLAAAFGLLVVALQIAYLPALYDTFNRRERLVTTLESRAGTPAWGPELLARHYLVGIETNLPEFYREWERWAADVAETHTTYPTLLYMRSPHPTNSWVVGLTAVLDSAALYLSLSPDTAPPEARLCLRMGFTALRDIARTIGIPFDPDPLPDSPIVLGEDEFAEAADRLARAGVPIERPASEAWSHFLGWRTNYEAIALALADRVYAPPALWTGGRGRRGVPMAPTRPVDRRPGMPEGGPAQRRGTGPAA